MAKVNVIIPAYNAEKYIEETLISLKQQTFNDYEIICVEDCSTDNTLSIIEKYAEDNKKIKIIRNKSHLGPGESRNIALRNSDCEIISCVDSDDVANENYLLEAVNKFSEIDVPSIWVKTEIYWEKEDKLTPMILFPILQYQQEGLLKLTPANITNYPAYSWNKFYKRESITDNVFWSPDYLFEDVEFYYRYYTQNPLLYVIDKNLYIYRRHSKSIVSTSTVDKNYHKNLFYVTENIYNFLVENNLFEIYKKSLLNLFMQNVKQYENFPHLEKELAQTVNECLKNIHFPEAYSDLAQ